MKRDMKKGLTGEFVQGGVLGFVRHRLYRHPSRGLVSGLLRDDSSHGTNGPNTMKILIADDDRISREILRNRLRAWGDEVIAVEDGAAAWKILRGPDALGQQPNSLAERRR